MRYNAENGHIDFPHALEVVIVGRKVKRTRWPEDAYVFRRGNEFFVHTPSRNNIEWWPTSEEMLAIDWMEVPA